MFTREMTERMGKAMSVYGYGIALGSVLGGFLLPILANWLIPSYELTPPTYPQLAIPLVQASIMIGFAWGAICGWLSGIFADPNITFNLRPQSSRLLGSLFVSVAAFTIAIRYTTPFVSLAICLLYMVCCWIGVSIVSRYFIDKDPFLSKYSCYLSELNSIKMENL